MQAIILAGGKGTRLRPYTIAMPKPLVPIGEYPILDIIIRQLTYYKVREVIISTGHLSELIEAYFRKGDRWGVKIRYAREDKALGTAGAVKNIAGLDDNFIVMNGDILTDINYRDLYNFHIRHKATATISTIRREILTDFGVLNIGEDNRLISYIEKPKRFDYVSIGVNILSRRCRDYIAKGESISIPELIWRMQSKKEKIYCYRSDSYWLDIGRIEDFQRAQEEFKRNKSRFHL
jgi:NDP-sugar pyrophosphorylase family protein